VFLKVVLFGNHRIEKFAPLGGDERVFFIGADNRLPTTLLAKITLSRRAIRPSAKWTAPSRHEPDCKAGWFTRSARRRGGRASSVRR
jgi:hypothetical protein